MRGHMSLVAMERADIGCLQDIHGAAGSWATFRAYSLGAVQLVAVAHQQLGNVADAAHPHGPHGTRPGGTEGDVERRLPVRNRQTDKGDLRAAVCEVFYRAPGAPLPAA
ncbi:hypothetical protein CUR178_04706 [Leishmania enriettii]|uniref:Uncharacterized protein n=1 Tax=Leishmania enriettii TaxID=5663 RepID=A0A836HV44_LEIEN|nr:hypothetical protein CUR178_04706 [Leishmania enriettii]